MTDPYAGMPLPPSDFPDKATALEPGHWIQGTITAVREFPTDDGAKPILDLQVVAASNPADNFPGQVRSYICGSMGLHSLVMAHRPPVGSTVTITCTGVSDKTKHWSLDVAGGAAPAPAPAAPAPAPAAAAPAPAPAPAPVPAPAVATPPAPVPAPAPPAPAAAPAPAAVEYE